jgi:hypothetical protein
VIKRTFRFTEPWSIPEEALEFFSAVAAISDDKVADGDAVNNSRRCGATRMGDEA